MQFFIDFKVEINEISKILLLQNLYIRKNLQKVHDTYKKICKIFKL